MNTKLLEMLATKGFTLDSTTNPNNNQKTRVRGKKVEKRLCGNCKREGYHYDDDCFGLEKNKANRPSWYKVKDGG